MQLSRKQIKDLNKKKKKREREREKSTKAWGVNYYLFFMNG
jgi:hypothetical protein